jgi:hypothetical protein
MRNLEVLVLKALSDPKTAYSIRRTVNTSDNDPNRENCIFSKKGKCTEKRSKQTTVGEHCQWCGRYIHEEVSDIYIIRKLKKLTELGILQSIEQGETTVVAGGKKKNIMAYLLTEASMRQILDNNPVEVVNDGIIRWKGQKYVRVI